MITGEICPCGDLVGLCGCIQNKITKLEIIGEITL